MYLADIDFLFIGTLSTTPIIPESSESFLKFFSTISNKSHSNSVSASIKTIMSNLDFNTPKCLDNPEPKFFSLLK